MSDELIHELRKIVGAVAIESDSKFRIEDEQREVNCLKPTTSDGERYLDSPLTTDLRNAIYARFYTRFRPTSDENSESIPQSQDDHLSALEKANTGLDAWDQNWRIIGIARKGLYATKSQRVIFVNHGFYILSEPGQEPKEGDLVNIRCFASSTKTQDGFYFGFSSIASATIGNRKSIRFYWNCRPEGAVEIFRETSARLNRFQIPYEIKCLKRPDLYSRRDSLVLYLRPNFFRSAVEQVKRLYPAVAPLLDHPVPLFTRQVAPGLGVAETPGGDISFGNHRCGLIAEALVQAHQDGVADNEKRMQLVAEHFAKNHISLDRPWLNHGDFDPFGVGKVAI